MTNENAQLQKVPVRLPFKTPFLLSMTRLASQTATERVKVALKLLVAEYTAEPGVLLSRFS